MKKLFLLLLPVVAVSVVNCGGKTDDAPAVHPGVGDPQDPRFAQLLSFVSSQMDEHHVPGGSVAVVQNGTLAFSAGLGVREAGRPEPVVATTLFRVASLSKMVLAATALSLEEEGKLDLDEPVTTYAPLSLQTPFQASSIKMTHLLTHTSGIPDVDIGSLSCGVGTGQLAAWFSSQPPQPLWTPPGQVWNYSNRGYSAAGLAIEGATKAPYETAATLRVLGPAGMKTATFDPEVARAADHAIGHVRTNGTYAKSDVDAFDCAALRPPAGVIASAVDYAHFAETLLAGGGSMISPASVAKMETGAADTDERPGGLRRYGYGIDVDENYKGLTVLHHNGDIGTGFRTSMWMVPDQKLAIIIFYNSLSANPDTAAKAGIDAFLGTDTLTPPDEKTTPAAWGAYAGTYVDPFDLGTINVSLANGALSLAAPSVLTGDVSLTEEQGDEFTATFEGQSGPIVFYPGELGPATWLVTRKGVGKRMQ